MMIFTYLSLTSDIQRAGKLPGTDMVSGEATGVAQTAPPAMKLHLAVRHETAHAVGRPLDLNSRFGPGAKA